MSSFGIAETFCYNDGRLCSKYKITISFDPNYGPERKSVVYQIIKSQNGREEEAFVRGFIKAFMLFNPEIAKNYIKVEFEYLGKDDM